MKDSLQALLFQTLVHDSEMQSELSLAVSILNVNTK